MSSRKRSLSKESHGPKVIECSDGSKLVLDWEFLEPLRRQLRERNAALKGARELLDVACQLLVDTPVLPEKKPWRLFEDSAENFYKNITWQRHGLGLALAFMENKPSEGDPDLECYKLYTDCVHPELVPFFWFWLRIPRLCLQTMPDRDELNLIWESLSTKTAKLEELQKEISSLRSKLSSLGYRVTKYEELRAIKEAKTVLKSVKTLAAEAKAALKPVPLKEPEDWQRLELD